MSDKNAAALRDEKQKMLDQLFSEESAPKATSDAPNANYYRSFVPQIQKRDGTIVAFDFSKIIGAIHKAMVASNEGSLEEAEMVAHKVASDVVRIANKYKNFLPTVEGVQDEVERQLILSDYVKTAKGYILYRNERARLRAHGIAVPERVKQLAEESAKYFKGDKLGEMVFLMAYSRWIPEEGRRETWIETVDRYMEFMKENMGDKLTAEEYTELREGILNQHALPSMRLMQFAGAPARRCSACAYNCSYIAPTRLEDFSEILYLSASGCGVGFSVESKNIEQLPQIKMQTGEVLETHVVGDSKEGWADALLHGIKTWYGGKDVKFDYSLIRPAGARLKTMGGRASGPEPLRALLDFAREKILARQGKRLRTIDAHDIICKIGDAIVSGGVRRSAMISLSDLDDELMRDAKKGQFYFSDPQRSLANNSAVYETKPSSEEFLDEWLALVKGKSGERGIFNRGGLMEQMPARRLEAWKKKGLIEHGRITGAIGTNPCGEILLQSKQFCNLTVIIAREADTLESLKKKVRLATILGTYQSTLSNFKYLSEDWKKNCEEERLLGVSITGMWDSPEVRKAEVLSALRDYAVEMNSVYAKRFGVNASTCVTSVKPAGQTSQAFNTASGLHARHSPYYIRRVRIGATNPLFRMLKDQGVPFAPEVGQSEESATTFVVEFPVKSPEGATFRNDLSALDQLEFWKKVKLHFTEHNPSVTISVGENEWLDVAHWLYENWEILGGLSFLPRSDHIYRLAPYEEINKEEYERRAEALAHVDFSKLVTYELEDATDLKKELACAGGTCEI